MSRASVLSMTSARCRVSLLAATMLVMGTAASAQAQFTVGPWAPSYDEAMRRADAEQKAVLIHFSATWCGPCQRMEREVFASPSIQQMLAREVVAVKVDADHQQYLLQRYGVNSLPSDIAVDPKTNRVLMKSQNFLDGQSYANMIANISATERQIVAQRAPQQPPQAQQSQGQYQARNQGTQRPDYGNDSRQGSQYGPPPQYNRPPQQSNAEVGMDGFSPVAMNRNRKWVKGNPSLAWEHKGITYLMSSPDELREFRADPDRFAPKLLGCDPVILWDTDRAVTGSTSFAAYYNDELFLFATEDSRSRFRANPERYVRTQHVLRLDQVKTLAEHLRETETVRR